MTLKTCVKESNGLGIANCDEPARDCPYRQSLAPARRFFCFTGFGRCVDCLRSAASGSTHLDAAGFRLFSFRQRYAQHAVVVLGGSALSGNGVGQRERTSERTVGALDSMIVVRLLRLLKLTFAA